MDVRISAHKFCESFVGSIEGGETSATFPFGAGQGVGLARSIWAIGWPVSAVGDTVSVGLSDGTETCCETVVQPIMVVNSKPHTLVYAILMKLVDTLLTTAKIGRYFRSES